MSEKTFKVGDKVRIRTDDRTRLTDYESDLLLNLEDGTITGRVYDVVHNGIEGRVVWTVKSIEKDPFDNKRLGYELVRGKTAIPWLFDSDDLEVA